MRLKLRYHFLILLVIIVPLSCMNDELWIDRDKPGINSMEVREHGVIIINEGNFTYGNSSLSYYNAETKKLENDVFYRQNGVPLGDVAYSAVHHDGQLYVVINNSGKVLKMNLGKYPALKAFEYTGKITGLISPRFITFLNERKAYISDLYAKKISIVDPLSSQLSGFISTDSNTGEYYRHPTEQMIIKGDLMFTNAYSFDDQILVINVKEDKVIDSIRVLKQPSGMAADKNGKLWVLCDGGYQGSLYSDESAGLVRINMTTLTIEKVFVFPKTDWPRKICLNGNADSLFFINRDIWSMSIADVKIPAEPLIKAEGKLFYSLAVDPFTSELYAGDAIDYIQPGVVYRYTSKGQIVDTLRAGVNPGAVIFIKSSSLSP
jgi:hypothetical protein